MEQQTGKLSTVVKRLRKEAAHRRQVDRTLRERDARTRAILDTAVDAIITIDARGTVQSFNRAAEHIFGYKAAEVVGRNIKMLMPEPYSTQHDSYLGDYLRTGQARIIGIGREATGRRKDGSTFPIDLAVSEVKIGDRHTFTGIVRDLTDRKRLEKEILEIAEREQRRIGQDLHDGVCQQLAGINFLVRALQRKVDAGEIPEAAQARKLTELMSDAIQQARGLSHGLNPVDPGADGLSAALRKLADNVRDVYHLEIEFRSNRSQENPVRLEDATAAIHLYRIAQEAVSNATRHGAATQIDLTLNGTAQSITLTIDDNGPGFTPPSPTAKGGGMGLRTMQHRANLIGATIKWTKSPLGGARVSCKLSLRRNLRPPTDLTLPMPPEARGERQKSPL